jgi:NADH-quinone oxidoreductase subunit J
MSLGESVLFVVMGPLMVISALGLLFVKKAVHAAMAMAAVMVALGVVYFAQDAPFLGGVQIFVYTGAVMMLFLFVLMLIGVDSADSLVETIKAQRPVAILFGAGTAAVLVAVLATVKYGKTAGLSAVNSDGNVGAISAKIFGDYVWAFEVTGALLITAALGAMILAHREKLVPRPTQRELSVKRIRDGAVKAPLPAPGVFARHNAVDTPALLPDGTGSELSVSRVLVARGQERSAVERMRDIAEVSTALRAAFEEGASPIGRAAPATTSDEVSCDDEVTGDVAPDTGDGAGREDERE